MSSTKIINILRDDRLDDISDIIESAPADEIILILPRANKLLNKEPDFIFLKNLADGHNKKISLLCSNYRINELARRHNFNVLSPSDADKRKLGTKKATVNLALSEEDLSDDSNVDINSKNLLDNLTEDIQNINEHDEENPNYGSAHSDQNDSDDYENELEEDDLNIENEAVPKDGSEDENEPWSNEEFLAEDIRFDNGNFEIVTASSNKKINDIVRPGRSRSNLRISKKEIGPFKVETRKDIKSGNITHKALDDIKKVWETKSSIWSNDRIKPKKSFRFLSVRGLYSNFSGKAVIVFGIVAILVFLTVIYLSTGSAKIIVTPRQEPLNFNLKITSSNKYSSIDNDLNRIPGQLLVLEGAVDDNFQATGERDVAQKARGTITVYNEFSSSPQTLIATTRFQSNDGLIFRTLKTISVPGTKVKNGDIVPGTVTVEVIADKAGESYNISAGRFVIPAFKERGDMERFYGFYAVSDESMKGGIVGKSKVVTESDYNKAQEKIKNELSNKLENQIKAQSSGLKILELGNINIETLESSALIDEAITEFTFSASGTTEIVGFRESDVHDLIISFVQKVNSMNVIPDKLTISFENPKFDPVNKDLEFIVRVSGPAYANLDKKEIIDNLINKKEALIKEYIRSINDISSAKVILQPFWVNKVPSDRDKIIFEFEYK